MMTALCFRDLKKIFFCWDCSFRQNGGNDEHAHQSLHETLWLPIKSNAMSAKVCHNINFLCNSRSDVETKWVSWLTCADHVIP